MLLWCGKETKNRENRKQPFFRKLRDLANRKKKFSKKFSRFRHVRLEEGLFFDYKNGHYKKMSRYIFLIFCNLMRNMIRNKKMSGSEKVNTGPKSSSKCSRSPVFAHNSRLVACKKALKNFFPRYCRFQDSNQVNSIRSTQIRSISYQNVRFG